jgi:hypothetical protein
MDKGGKKLAKLDPVTELKSDHRLVREIILELIDVVSKRDAAKALELLLYLDKKGGPHFRFEEEAFYLALEKFYGREYLEYLLGAHDRILNRAGYLAGILGKGEISEEEAKILPGVLRTDVLSHPIECEGITLFAEKLSKKELDSIADKIEEARKADVPLLLWGNSIKDMERARRGLKAKVLP